MGITTQTDRGDGDSAVIDPLACYKISDIDPTEGNSYFGYIDKDGGWYMMNLTATTAIYAKGDSGYAAAWANKGNQNWGLFNEIF